MRKVGRLAVVVSLAAASLFVSASVASGVSAAPAKQGFDVPDIVWPPKGTHPVHLSSQQLWTRSSLLQARMEEKFPGVVPQAENIRVQPPHSDTGGNYDGQQYMTGFVEFRDRIGSTGVSMQFNAPGFFKESPKQLCGGRDVVSCHGRMLGDGSVVTDVVQQIGPKQRIGTSYHHMPDGSVTFFSSYNYDPIFDGNTGPQRDRLAVSLDQLDRLASDPDMTFR